MTILSTYYSDQRVDSSGLRQKLYALLTILATVTLSPTTVDFLTAAFFRLNIPVGTYMFFGFIGLTALMVVGGFVNRTGFSYATTLFIICLSLAATSLWSPSSNYLATKLPLVIITPTILFLSGFMIAAAGRTTDLGMSVVGFGLVILLGIWIFGEDTIVGFQVGLTDEFGGRYQSISRVLAVSVITCFTFSVTDTVRWRQTLLLAVGSLLAFQILYSGGRVGFLILVITMPILIASLLRGRHMVLVLLLWMVLMALFSYILDLRALAEMIWPTQMPLTIDRILMEFSNNSVTQFEAMQRSNLWLTAIDLWRENPLLGVGLAGFPLHAGFGDVLGVYPHNIILELGCETGLVGLVLFSAFCFFCLFRGSIYESPRVERLIAIGVITSGIAISSVISDFGLQRELFMGLGLICGLKNRNALKLTQVNKTPAKRCAKLVNWQ